MFEFYRLSFLIKSLTFCAPNPSRLKSFTYEHKHADAIVLRPQIYSGANHAHLDFKLLYQLGYGQHEQQSQ